jgi:predicted oxidoreductase
MKKLQIGNMSVSAISLGCMKMSRIDEQGVDAIIDCALKNGINYFDHADIYGRGESEQMFGGYLKRHPSARENMFIQTKCAIKGSMDNKLYDFSKEHIISSVEQSLLRLGTDYIDALLLHRPDTLMEPYEVAEAFDALEASGKVRYFGVSNHTPMQIELLKTAVKQPLLINQLQFSVTEAGMVTSGLNTNMKNIESIVHDGYTLEYSRIKNITIQAWSPLKVQYEKRKDMFVDNPYFSRLNNKLEEIANKYGITKSAVAIAWILRHPANMQSIVGTMNPEHLNEICKAANIEITREEWYQIYLAAGHRLP